MVYDLGGKGLLRGDWVEGFCREQSIIRIEPFG